MKDKSAINLRKSRNRGSTEQGSNVPDKDGQIMAIASKDVVSIPPTKSLFKGNSKAILKYISISCVL